MCEQRFSFKIDPNRDFPSLGKTPLNRAQPQKTTQIVNHSVKQETTLQCGINKHSLFHYFNLYVQKTQTKVTKYKVRLNISLLKTFLSSVMLFSDKLATPPALPL